MTDKHLKRLIHELNNGKTNGLFHLRSLTLTVDFAKVWINKPKPTDSICYPDGPQDFYFIKDETGFYVAIVLDMKEDLHWFVLEKYRRGGHLTKAMQSPILKHLFQSRSQQRITIDEEQIGRKNFEASERVAYSLGFRKVNATEYLLLDKQLLTDSPVRGQNSEMTKERMEQLKKQVNYLSLSLWMIQTELEMTLGNSDYTNELKALVDEIKSHSLKLENAWWESKK
ncbi:MAG TPA: hypothetical protein VL098_05900 [Flavipsychrobacter sp.]|nr:hypothetical protein [Flavipsychrobacter sp.]